MHQCLCIGSLIQIGLDLNQKCAWSTLILHNVTPSINTFALQTAMVYSDVYLVSWVEGLGKPTKYIFTEILWESISIHLIVEH